MSTIRIGTAQLAGRCANLAYDAKLALTNLARGAKTKG
jgi:hypothetical protein